MPPYGGFSKTGPSSPAQVQTSGRKRASPRFIGVAPDSHRDRVAIRTTAEKIGEYDCLTRVDEERPIGSILSIDYRPQIRHQERFDIAVSGDPAQRSLVDSHEHRVEHGRVITRQYPLQSIAADGGIERNYHAVGAERIDS